MADPEELLEKPTIYIDPEKCLGCRSCEFACAVEHSMGKSPLSVPYEVPKPKPRIKVVVTDFFPVPMRCQHCEDPPCLRVCPTGAISKKGSFVVLNPNSCIGCLMCVMACPFGHPRYYSEYKVVLKCDGCHERVERGEVPACVEACPTHALKFGTLSEILEEVRKESAEKLISGIKVPGIVYIKPVEEKKEEKRGISILDVNLMYSEVRWW